MRMRDEPLFSVLTFADEDRGGREHEASAQATFLMELAAALAMYGSPAHRVELAVEQCARGLGLAAQFFVLPTGVYATLGEGWDARTYLRRVPQLMVNLERLVLLDQVLQRTVAGDCDVEEATDAIRSIKNAAPRYGVVAWSLAFAASAAAFAPLFGGGLREVIAAAFVGVLIAILDCLTFRYAESRRLYDFCAGFVAALASGVLARVMGPISYEIVLISGLIVLIPGLTITMAIKELSTVNLVAGTARLTGAMMILVLIAFGIAIGNAFAEGVVGPPPVVASSPLPPWIAFIAIPLAATGLSMSFRARPRDMLSMIVAGAIGYSGARLGGGLVEPEIGAFIGAFGVGLFSNVIARILNRPAAVTMVPGIILLVPGSVGFRSITSFMDHDPVSGIQTAFTMVVTAVALAVGLLMANIVVPPRRAL